MADLDSLLNRWQTAGVLDAGATARIREFEASRAKPSGLRWQGIVALILGAILLACGVVLFVSAHWDELGPGSRYVLVMALVAVFHVGGALVRGHYRGLSTALHAVGTISTGAAIALVGQIFNIQEHWPAAILMWAIAALAGWILLGDEAQQTLALLVFPAWIQSELSFAMQSTIGAEVYLGRFGLVWSSLYLTVFLGTRRRAVKGILFAVSAIQSIASILLIFFPWSFPSNQPTIPVGVRIWAWIAIAVLPLVISLFNLKRSPIPVVAALFLSLVLPWCGQRLTEGVGSHDYIQVGHPNLLAHALVTAYAVFFIWWGVRQTSRALVNLGIVGFAISVAWFYFSDIFDKVGRSLGLIGLGVLFLAGGWALEKARRGLIARMTPGSHTAQEAQ